MTMTKVHCVAVVDAVFGNHLAHALINPGVLNNQAQVAATYLKLDQFFSPQNLSVLDQKMRTGVSQIVYKTAENIVRHYISNFAGQKLSPAEARQHIEKIVYAHIYFPWFNASGFEALRQHYDSSVENTAVRCVAAFLKSACTVYYDEVVLPLFPGWDNPDFNRVFDNYQTCRFALLAFADNPLRASSPSETVGTRPHVVIEGATARDRFRSWQRLQNVPYPYVTSTGQNVDLTEVLWNRLTPDDQTQVIQKLNLSQKCPRR